MRRGRRLLMNAAVMSGTALLLRFVGVSFGVWLSNRIGEAGMGLFQLVSSAHLMAVTFATSGIRTATVRLLSEENALSSRGNALKSCIGYALFFGFLSAAALYFSAQFIGEAWIGDARSVLSLRILALTLPLIAVSSVFGGVFVSGVSPAFASVSAVCEQTAKIAVAAILLARLVSPDIERSCAAVVTGSVAGEAAGLFAELLLYFLFCRRKDKPRVKTPGVFRRLLGISIPLAVSAYVRCALSTAEHMLIPRALRRSGLSADAALADYGMIHGMVFPVITFPLAFFSVCAELAMPELTRSQVRGSEKRIRSVAGRCLYLSLFFSLLIAAALFIFADGLGQVLFSSAKAGKYIRLFAPLMPVMYLDTVTDGLLKGLGEHLASMRYNIADALMSVALVVTLLPRYAVTAYIGIIYFTECFNFIMSIRRLARVMPSGKLPSFAEDVRWLCGVFR